MLYEVITANGLVTTTEYNDFLQPVRNLNPDGTITSQGNNWAYFNGDVSSSGTKIPRPINSSYNFV